MDKMEEFRSMFATRLGVKRVDENKTLKELGLDSLDVAEMCLELEDRFGVSIDISEFASLKTVADLYALVAVKLAQ